MRADYVVHALKNTHDLHDVEICTVHRPGYFCGGSRPFESELIDVMSFKRPYEINLDGNLFGRHRSGYRHPSVAGTAGAVPIRNCTLAVCRPTVDPSHRRVLFVLGCPAAPIVKVVDQRKDFFRRSVDIDRALDT